MYVKISKNENGSHAFQTGGPLENGWAVIPDEMELPATFPFVNIEVDMVTRPSVNGGAPTVRLEVVSMTEGEEIPTNEPSGTSEESVWDLLDAAYQEGVDSV